VATVSAEFVYPEDGLCVGSTEPLWDLSIEGETVPERTSRHHRGAEVCRRCPVRLPCVQAVDRERDEGVRGGVLHGKLRRPIPLGYPDGREGSGRKRRTA
jgi:hypothetical protein